MVIKLLVALLYILLSTTAAQQCYPLYSQELINSMGPTFLPSSSSSSSSFPPTPTASIESNPTSFVPALFVIGDSSVECGTNNFLGTFARADRLPFGRDFDTHQPTRRFCNGRIPVDYLALRLGLPFVPKMIHILNFASASAEIIFTSGLELGQHVSFNQQFIISLGEQATIDLVSNSVLYISNGINDYIHYYLHKVSNVQNLYFPWGFNQFLTSTLRFLCILMVQNLYNINVMKVVVIGLALIGCAPHYLSQYRVKDGQCIKEINNMVMEFNFVMRYMIEELREELPVTNIIFYNMFEGSMDIIKNFARYGESFNETTVTFCGLGEHKGFVMCLSPDMACNDASNHVWWDQFHPTDAVNAILADNVWNGLHTKLCYPMNLGDMVVSSSY
ncbi:GDSL esterase/lipase [Pyrus ussuriensis x Pyrus communis]|uniref:GDSL esterase/lipase n=1 Tax=Pyrus ussuriensis x Pyrus communis TaxID=2448454 RepID=A0A5N5GYQ4_9ROSA|nr:GDSL esterase/lipase [Pyrus ussuriensis x Pyrus communis]